MNRHAAPSPTLDPTDVADHDAVRDPADPVMPHPGAPRSHPRRRPAVIVAGSVLAGLVAAAALVLGPFAGRSEAVEPGLGETAVVHADRGRELRRPVELGWPSSRPAAAHRPGWTAEQNDLAGLSSRSVHRTIAGSTHQSLIDDERDAARSGRAIGDVVRAVRAGG